MKAIIPLAQLPSYTCTITLPDREFVFKGNSLEEIHKKIRECVATRMYTCYLIDSIEIKKEQVSNDPNA
jgi:hypothetical protein